MDSELDWTGPDSGALARLPVGRAGPGRAPSLAVTDHRDSRWQGDRHGDAGWALHSSWQAQSPSSFMMTMTENSAAAGAGRGPRCTGTGTQAATLSGGTGLRSPPPEA